MFLHPKTKELYFDDEGILVAILEVPGASFNDTVKRRYRVDLDSKKLVEVKSDGYTPPPIIRGKVRTKINTARIPQYERETDLALIPVELNG